MSPCLSADDLEQVLNGTLPDGRADVVRAHLRACAFCRERLDRLTEDAGVARQPLTSAGLAPETLPDPVLHALLHSLDARPARGGGFTPGLGAPQEPGDLGTLGSFRIMAQLGSGGMGIVYRAYDVTLGRTVAVKVMRAERADAGARARLRREARAVAGLRHPHVVAVHAVVEPAGEAPYIVMEHVDGPTLAERLHAEGQLTPREAAELAAQAAEGLAAAHAAGLVHRDVKPGNLIRDERAGAWKLLDFGLAGRAGGLTVADQVAGTPEYMSPEQVARPAAVDARTDVYALGVTLFEALTGEPPFRGTPAAVLRQVLHEEPRPVRQWNDAVPRDLETVCLKAMAKEPARRYATAAELAADLRRWLAGEPVRARPVGRVGKAARWCRRNPAVAALSAALGVALCAGMAGVVGQWRRAEDQAAWALSKSAEAERETAEAVREHDRALANLRDARAAVDRFLTRVSEDRLTNTPGALPLRKQLLEEALGYYRGFLERHGDEPGLEAETAAAALRAATVAMQIGRTDEALAGFAEAARRYEALGRAGPPPWQLAHCHNISGYILQRAQRHDEATKRFRQAAAACERGLAADPKSLPLRGNLAACYGNLANVATELGRREEALAWYRKVQALFEALAAEYPGNVAVQTNVALNLHNMAMLETDPAKALRLLGQARERRERLYRDSAKSASAGFYLARTLDLIASCQSRQGKLTEAITTARKAQCLLAPIAAANPAIKEYQRALAQLDMNLGCYHAKAGRYAESLAALAAARAADERVLRADPAFASAREGLAETWSNTGDAYRAQGQPGEAVRALRECYAARLRLAREAAGAAPPAHVLAATAARLAGQLQAAGRHTEALAVLDEVDPLLRAAAAKAPQDVELRRALDGQTGVRFLLLLPRCGPWLP